MVLRGGVGGGCSGALVSLSNLRDRVIEQMSVVIRGGEIPFLPRHELNKVVAEKLGVPLLLNSTARGLAAAAPNAEDQAQQLEARAAVNPDLHQTAAAARGTTATRRQHANRARDAAGVERAAVEAAPAPVVNAQA
ncbi:unnamed protein product [Miscanthus lutarioriparius]|uniref:Uncharacterized protein n=1 Tax=Miscanthus lutarioriparius TaxID=422564 RepID=A0A811N5N4_9POAL|nr:unnamed protein product [Miscanthus lutarioriparius]